MSQFSTYFQLGVNHILDLGGYDHILFVIVLCALYTPSEWKKIVILVSSFTLGHSITLALATLNILRFSEEIIEFCIPLTILITAFSNIIKPKSSTKMIQINYFLAGGFGLIHGMGFSNYLRALLGKEQSILEPLLAFNLGLELGQLVIVFVFGIVAWVLSKISVVKQRDWTLVISSIVAGMSLVLLIEAKFW